VGAIAPGPVTPQSAAPALKIPHCHPYPLVTSLPCSPIFRRTSTSRTSVRCLSIIRVARDPASDCLSEESLSPPPFVGDTPSFLSRFFCLPFFVCLICHLFPPLPVAQHHTPPVAFLPFFWFILPLLHHPDATWPAVFSCSRLLQNCISVPRCIVSKVAPNSLSFMVFLLFFPTLLLFLFAIFSCRRSSYFFFLSFFQDCL